MAIYTESGEVVAPVNLDGTPMESASDTEEGAREQELAEPASEPDTEEGAEEQDVADPAEVEETEETEEAVPETEEQVEPAKQSKAENRKQAAKRRAEEIEAAKTAAADEVIAGLQIINPATGKPCATYKEYTEMLGAQAAGRARAELAAKGIDPAAVEGIIMQNPVVQAAEAAIASAEDAEANANKKADGLSFEKLLKDVGEIIPEIRTAEDLFSWEFYDEFRLLVSGGKDPVRVAELLNAPRNAEKAKQAAMNAMASKAHLTATNTRRSSGGDYGISDAQYANMLAMNPGMTRKEAAMYVKKYGG